MTTDPLLVPNFARLDEYFGLWAVELDVFAAVWRAAKGEDFTAHFRAAAGQKVESRRADVPAANGKSVAVIEIAGTLMKQQSSMGGTSTVQLRRDIRAAAADKTVSGILLAIDSPGGTVAGTEDLAADVKAARRAKPVWAQITDLGASAAYWVASQADRVFAGSQTTRVGSIGTFGAVYDLSAAAEKEGVKALVFKTGPLKGAGFPGTPVTDEQAADYQRLVNETQAHFDAAVKAGRGMGAGQLAAVRTGGVFLAADALEKKLIDGIQPSGKTLADLAAAR